MKKQLKAKFGWDVDALDPYVDQESLNIVTNEVLVGDTLSLISIEEDVKFKKKLKKMDASVNWASGDACGFTPNEDNVVEFTDREIETVNLKFEQPFCNLDLIGTWAQKALRKGAVAELEELPYRDLVTTYLASLQGMEIEKALWRGNKATGTGNLSFFDGLETVIAAESANCININTGGATTFTEANAYDVMWSAFKDYSASDLGQAVLETGNCYAYLTRNQFNTLVKSIDDLNRFNFDPMIVAREKQFVFPGTDLIIKRFNGRNDDTKFYFANPSNLVFGTDLTADSTNLDLWYNKDEEELRFRLRMRAGTQIRKPEEIGYFELAPEGGE